MSSLNVMMYLVPLGAILLETYVYENSPSKADIVVVCLLLPFYFLVNVARSFKLIS